MEKPWLMQQMSIEGFWFGVKKISPSKCEYILILGLYMDLLFINVACAYVIIYIVRKENIDIWFGIYQLMVKWLA